MKRNLPKQFIRIPEYLENDMKCLTYRKSSNKHLGAYSKTFQFFAELIRGWALISKVNEERTELIHRKEELCKTLLKSSFCLSFFLTVTSKYVYQLS